MLDERFKWNSDGSIARLVIEVAAADSAICYAVRFMSVCTVDGIYVARACMMHGA